MTLKNMINAKPKLQRLKLTDLSTDEQEFQPRDGELDGMILHELTQLADRGIELTPLTVWVAEDGARVIADGHHRFAAYIAAGWAKKVPVVLHRCSRVEARLLPTEDNAKVRRPLSKVERVNRVWMLTVVDNGGDNYSINQLSKNCAVSPRTVSNMRNKLAALVLAGEDIPDTWAEALNGAASKPRSNTDHVDWEELQIKKLVDEIGASLSRVSKDNPEIAAAAVAQIMGARMEQGMEWVGFVPAPVDDDGEPLF